MPRVTGSLRFGAVHRELARQPEEEGSDASTIRKSGPKWWRAVCRQNPWRDRWRRWRALRIPHSYGTVELLILWILQHLHWYEYDRAGSHFLWSLNPPAS